MWWLVAERRETRVRSEPKISKRGTRVDVEVWPPSAGVILAPTPATTNPISLHEDLED